MSSSILSLVLYYSAMYGVDPLLAMSVIKVESNFNPRAVGSVGEIGLMQLRPQYFGKSRDQLFDPAANIKIGIKYLSEVKAACRHKAEKAFVVCYNLGVAGGNRIKHPTLWPYYKKVMAQYKGMKKEFKRDEKVYVLHAHVGGADIEGKIIRKGFDFPNQHKWLVDFGYVSSYMEPERILTEDDYISHLRRLTQR